MKTEWLQIIVATNKYNSISEAASHCNITQPAASRMIVNAENELNTRIFTRSTKTNGVELTKEGKQLFPFIKNALTSLEELENAAHRTKSCDLLLGMSEDTWGATARSKIIGGFYLCNPNSSLHIITAKNDDLFRNLMQDKVDLIIYSMGDDANNHFNPFTSLPVCVEHLGDRPISIAYNQASPIPGISPEGTIKLIDLKECNFIVHFDVKKANTEGRRFFFPEACNNAGFEPKFKIVPNACDIKQSLTLCNEGIYMSSAPIGLREYPGISYARVSDMPYGAKYYAVYKTTNRSAELLELIQFIKSFF